MILMLAPFLARLRAQVWNGEFDMSLIITIALIVCVFGIITATAMRIGIAMINAAPASWAARVSERTELSSTAIERSNANAPRPAQAEPAWQVTVLPPVASHRLHEGLSTPAATAIVPASQRIGQALRRKTQSKTPLQLTKPITRDSR
jgi:hypothetical protein